MNVARRIDQGQATVEWIALLAVVVLMVVGLLATGLRVPGTTLAESIAKRLVCAVRLGSGCGGPGELTIAYGPELGALIAEHAPLVAYERGMRDLPVDFRECREVACANGARSGRATYSALDEPVTAFTRVLDCRNGGEGGDGECSGDASGNLYLQFWFYYPDSYTAPWPRSQSAHDDDWESYQVRIGPDGTASARASAHHGYGYKGGPSSWANEVGKVPVIGVPLPKTAGWGPSLGTLWVSADSHAGRVVTADFDRKTPRRKLWLIPLEEIAANEGLDYEFAVTPPWHKGVWTDPESKNT